MITKPIIAKIRPPILNFCSDKSFMEFSILLIPLGNNAYRRPSINSNKPTAVKISSINYFFKTFLRPDSPKYLKNSLSGDKTKDVSLPLIKDFS